MAGDFKALTEPGRILQSYTHMKPKAIWRGNFHSLVEASLEIITEMVNQSEDPGSLEIDPKP